ncbi:MAG: TIGR01244 family phosphatase [Robiginitomaculum sp.]|nr:TIGR01244 family phosphatase [Robiginitomaculum sp.]
MTTINKLSDDISACAQIFPEHIDFIQSSGFKSIICNRPDMEKPGQPFAGDIEKHAKDAGLSYIHIPMRPGQLTQEIIEAMRTAFETAPKPILIHCASGTRSAMLWSFIHVKELGVDGVLAATGNAGFDLEKIRPALVQFSD